MTNRLYRQYDSRLGFIPILTSAQDPLAYPLRAFSIMAQRTFSTEAYFQTQKPPAGLDERTAKVAAFVDKWKESGKRVVLVTVSSLAQVARHRD